MLYWYANSEWRLGTQNLSGGSCVRYVNIDYDSDSRLIAAFVDVTQDNIVRVMRYDGDFVLGSQMNVADWTDLGTSTSSAGRTVPSAPAAGAEWQGHTNLRMAVDRDTSVGDTVWIVYRDATDTYAP